MAIDRLDWGDLHFLLAASRVGYLSGLARTLKVDATTVGRRLKALEAGLDIPLFVRSRGKLELTEQGRRLVRHAERMEQAELDLRLEAHKLKAAPEGTVRISAPPTLARYALAPALMRLMQNHPGLSIELEIEPANVRIERWETDLALRLGPPLEAHDTVLARRIGHAGYAVFGPVTPPVPQRWIAYPKRFSHVPEAQWVERELNGASPVLRVNDPLAMAQAVAKGAGRALLPELMGSALPEIEQQGSTVLNREIWVLRHPDSGTTPLAQIACEWLVDVIRAAG